VFKSIFFVLRLAVAWLLVVMLAIAIWEEIPFARPDQLADRDRRDAYHGPGGHGRGLAPAPRRLIAGRIDSARLSNRQRRQIEIPFEAGEAFDLLDAAIRELPRVEEVESARDSLQVSAPR
jgi:hypothetical protein